MTHKNFGFHSLNANPPIFGSFENPKIAKFSLEKKPQISWQIVIHLRTYISLVCESTENIFIVNQVPFPMMSLVDLLYFIWLLTSCPAARADISDSSPASTAPATMVARRLALAPGDSSLAPLTPSKSRQAAWPAKWVPPPTVPTYTQHAWLEYLSIAQYLCVYKQYKFPAGFFTVYYYVIFLTKLADEGDAITYRAAYVSYIYIASIQSGDSVPIFILHV